MNDVSEVRDWSDAHFRLVNTFFRFRARRRKTQRMKTTMKIHAAELYEGERHCKTFEIQSFGGIQKDELSGVKYIEEELSGGQIYWGGVNWA